MLTLSGPINMLFLISKGCKLQDAGRRLQLMGGCRTLMKVAYKYGNFVHLGCSERGKWDLGRINYVSS